MRAKDPGPAEGVGWRSCPAQGTTLAASETRAKILVAFSQDEYRRIRPLARQAGLSISMWVGAVVRARVWAKPTFGAPADLLLAEALTELRRMSLTLAHLAQQPQEPDQASCQHQAGVLAQDVAAAIRSLRQALDGNLNELGHGGS